MKTPADRLPSLRRELATSLVVVGGVWLLAVFLTMAYGIRHEIDDLMDDALHEAAEVLYGTLVLDLPALAQVSGDTLPAPPHQEKLFWQIVDQNQHVVLRSHGAPPAPMLASFVPGLSDGLDHRRVYAMRLPQDRHVLLVGQDHMERLESRWEAIAVVGASGAVVSLVCALWMRRRVVRALQPLHELSEQIKAYDPGQSQAQLPAPSRQEFVAVHGAIMDLGRRLARRVEQEQAFAAHAAHALRTPLAGMDAQLAMAMKEVPQAAQKRLLRAREAAARLKKVINSLLVLFRSHAALELEPVWIRDLVALLPIERLDVHVEQQSPLTADANLVAAALSNLLDNAQRGGARNCWIGVQVAETAQTLTLRDDGPGLSQDRIDRLQAGVDQPADEGRAGLGLKLAALVARAHHGRLRIAPAQRLQGGFQVSLSFWENAAVASIGPATGQIPAPAPATGRQHPPP